MGEEVVSEKDSNDAVAKALRALTAEMLAPMVKEAVRTELDKLADDRLLSLEEVAELFGVTTVTIRAWIKARGFPGKKLGVVWRFKRSAVMAWHDNGPTLKIVTRRKGA
jgi:excisionase family DNA binding protein